jgi:tetratricopeptide (TPR) repeat protein
VASESYQVTRLDEIERAGSRAEWIPIRRHFEISAFGVNAWSSDEDGAEIVPEHEEISTGHEELYVVMSGRVTFRVDGKEIDGPTGTILFVRDPAVNRGARTTGGGASVLTAGNKPGEAYEVQPWEENADIFALFGQGEYAEAKRRLEELVAKSPDSAGPLYNLACAEARLGEREAALEHLAKAVELNPPFADLAREDEDFESIRDDARFLA